jgi:hypothetical protein
MLLIVSIKKMANQPAVKVARPHIPISDWVGQIHIPCHHNMLAVMGSMMSSNGVY